MRYAAVGLSLRPLFYVWNNLLKAGFDNVLSDPPVDVFIVDFSFSVSSPISFVDGNNHELTCVNMKLLDTI